jgi:hypothetical protein
MKPGTLLFVGCAALIVIVALALRSARTAAESRSAATALITATDQLRANVGQMEKRRQAAQASTTAEAPRAPAQNSTTANTGNAPQRPQPSPSKSAADGSVSKSERSPRPTTTALIASDPGMSATYLANFRTQLDLDYGGVFKALRLSPEQIEKFKDVEVRLKQDEMDLQAAIETQRLDPNGPEARKLKADYDKSRAAKKAEVLGDLAERYLEYTNTAGLRSQVQKLTAPDLVPGQSVTAEQVERATDILIANGQRKAGTRVVPPGTVNWNVAREQLKDVLSPAQVEWLGLFIEERAAVGRGDQLKARITAESKQQSDKSK